MARSIMPTQHKLAEKLSILNDRASGMLIRIYNIKKMMGNPETKPHFFSEKSLDSVIKTIVKKFPTLSSNNYSSTVSPIKEEIIKSLSLYYYTFVDIMDLKDHITDLLTTIDASQVHFDITLNFDLTKNYLDLILSYFCIMILLTRVEDRKAVLGLFSVAFELQSKKQEDSFPRLGQMVIDYESPLKKMTEEFIPHSKCLSQALLSLGELFKRRTQKAEEWRSAQFLSLLADSSKIMHSIQSDVIQCEYLSLDLVEKWIAIGFLLCYQHLQTPECYELWKQSLQGGYVISLCRDEILLIHSFAAGFLDGIKGFGKKATEVKDTFHQTVSNMPLAHREKRKFLRTALKELATIFIDQPGLLGPKGLYLLMGLSLARDEFLWMLRHADNVPQKKGSIRAEDLVDRQIAELMFHMEELRGLVRKYSRVIQRYYIQYLLGYDATILNQLMQALPAFPEDESLILTSLYSYISNLSVKQVEENETFDFTSLRLDWFRLQAYSSGTKSALSLRSNKELARHMNKIVLHSKMVDSLEDLLLETSDLSIYCFYTSILEQQFKQCMEFPAQHRFSISFPMVCSHFMQTTHPLCPEERHSIGTTSIQYAHWFLKEMSEEVNQVITAICEEQCILADKLLPKNAVSMVTVNVSRKKDKKNKPEKNEAEKKPGDESRRKHREEFTRMDKLHMALTELCYSMNYCNVITVWSHGFVPREFFSQQLETRFNKSLVGMMMYSPETRDVAKPSELLNSIKAVMSVLQSIENYVHIDISKIFNSILPQQSQPTDSCHGDATICANYTEWYLDLMKRVGQGQAIYSQNHKAFISTGLDTQCSFQMEEYADLMELRALAELIGPYGMKFLSERLMNEISKEVDDLKKCVIQNKQVLMDLRSNFDKPEVMKELQKKLTNADNVLQKMTKIGILLAFRGLAQEALLDVLEMRIPFLVSSIKDFQQHTPNGQESMIVNEMASAAGLPCDVDPALCAALRLQKPETGEDDYTVACLLMVFIATSIPRLVRTDSSAFKVAFEGHSNNIHCLAKAINSLAGAMFTVLGHGDVEMRLKEFLALTSSSLLRLGQETEKEVIKNRESVYLLLDEIIQESPFLTMDLLESCFPYALLRTSYHHVYKNVSI